MKEPGAARMKEEPRKKQVLGSGGAGTWVLSDVTVITVITATEQSTVCPSLFKELMHIISFKPRNNSEK